MLPRAQAILLLGLGATGSVMETIAYSQVQELVLRLPARKLRLAYSLLMNLVGEEVDASSPQIQFMLLPLDERRRHMAQQAQKMIKHYAQSAAERQTWQAGDFSDAN